MTDTHGGDGGDGAARSDAAGRRAFRVAYDGSGYRGFQRQPHGDTVADALLDALCQLDVLGGAPQPSGATRETPPGWAGVRVWASADAPPDFHATHDARERRYEYHLHAPEADDRAVEAAADRLSGEVDLHNLTPDARGPATRRDLSLSVERDGSYLLLRATADGFPRECVRRIAGLLAAVGAGDRDPAFLDRVLGEASLSGPDGVAPARPEPLVLTGVDYDLAFSIDHRAAATAWTVFEARRVERTTGARVAERLRRGASREP